MRCWVVNGSSPVPVIGHNLSDILRIIGTVLLLITHHYDSYLDVVPRAVAGAPGLGPGVRCVGPHWPAGPQVLAGAAWQERSTSGLRTPAQCRPETRRSGHHGVTSEITSWVVTYSKKPGPLTNIAQVPTPGRSETGSPITGAAFISSAPAWHTPLTQVSSGHQWNYLNVQHRENILSAGKKWIWLDYSWGLERRPCSLSPSDCYGENFKSVRMPLVTLQLLTSLSPKSISTTSEKRA